MPDDEQSLMRVTQSSRDRGALRGRGNVVELQHLQMLGKLGEGTFGEVYKAEFIQGAKAGDGKIYAVKKILLHNERDGFPITALREIKLLKALGHTNVLELTDMAVKQAPDGELRKRGVICMLSNYMDHDLSGLLENPEVMLDDSIIKCYMMQLLQGIKYLHDNHVLHRDLKAANVLLNNKGILQIADFGLARYYDEPIPVKGQGGAGEARRDYTALVVTRWYRPPELLLGLRKYTSAIDMWGVGCIFAEMYRRRPILRGDSDVHQIRLIFGLVGSPTEETMPGWKDLAGCNGIKEFAYSANRVVDEFREMDNAGVDLLKEFLKLDWRKRITAVDALDHPWFYMRPLAAKPGHMPTYSHSHELDRRKWKDAVGDPRLPAAPVGGSVGMGHNGEFAPHHHNHHHHHNNNHNGQNWQRGDRRPQGGRPTNNRPGWARDNGRDNGRDGGRDNGNNHGGDSYKPSYRVRDERVGSSASQRRSRSRSPRRERVAFDPKTELYRR